MKIEWDTQAMADMFSDFVRNDLAKIAKRHEEAALKEMESFLERAIESFGIRIKKELISSNGLVKQEVNVNATLEVVREP